MDRIEKAKEEKWGRRFLIWFPCFMGLVLGTFFALLSSQASDPTHGLSTPKAILVGVITAIVVALVIYSEGRGF